MGWLMSLSKGFIRFFESAKKKNYLAKASILFYFIHQLSSIASKTITLHPPCAPRRSCVLSYPSPIPPGCFWLVVVRISIVWRLFRPRYIFFFFNLSINSTAGMMTWRHPTRSAQVGSLLHRFPHRLRQLFFDCCIVPQKGGHQGRRPVSLSLSFDWINSPPQTTG